MYSHAAGFFVNPRVPWGEPRRDCVSCFHSRLEVRRQNERQEFFWPRRPAPPATRRTSRTSSARRNLALASRVVQRWPVGSRVGASSARRKRRRTPRERSRRQQSQGALKAQRRNKIKDFIDVAGSLHVSFFLIVSSTEQSSYLRLVRSPCGPTLTWECVGSASRRFTHTGT